LFSKEQKRYEVLAKQNLESKGRTGEGRDMEGREQVKEA
jgi:hypothetical protein